MCSIWYARRKLLNELDSYDDYKHEKKKKQQYIFCNILYSCLV